MLKIELYRPVLSWFLSINTNLLELPQSYKLMQSNTAFADKVSVDPQHEMASGLRALPMDHLSEIPQFLSRISYLLRLCDDHRDVEGCSDLLVGLHDQLQMSLRNVEDFLRNCSASFSKDREWAISTAHDATIDVADDDATDATPAIIPNEVTAINQDLPSKKRKRAGTEWTSLDRIVEKVASPDEIFEALMTRAGKYSSQTSRLRYLTKLFFHFAGPYAFEQVRGSFSAIHCTKEIDLTTLGVA